MRLSQTIRAILTGRSSELEFVKLKENPNEGASTNDVLWSDSMLYSAKDFPRYNPDDLIGRKGHEIYKRMMNDEQLKVAVKFRRNAVTSRDWVFEFDESVAEELSDEEKDLRIAVMTHGLRRMPGSFKRSLNFVMKAMYQGFSITEKNHVAYRYRDKVWWGLKNMRPKPFHTFYPVTDEFGSLVRLEQQHAGKTKKVDLSKVVWYVINPDVDEYYGQSELKEAYRDWYSKDVLTKLENIYLERIAGGLVWAQQMDGITKGTMTPEDKQKFEMVLANIQTKTGIKMPAGWELKVNNPTNTTAFSDAIERHDRNMAKALLMPNLIGLTESGQTGSYSQSQTNLEAFLWMLDSDADDLSEILNEQVFHQLGEANWGDGLYPEFRLRPLSKNQLYVVIDVWNKLVTSGAVEVTDSDEEYLRELLDFPVKGKPIKKEQPVDDPNNQNNPVQSGATGDNPDNPKKPDADDEQQGTKDANDDNDETSMSDDDHTFFPEGGAMVIPYASFNRIQRRVDFAAIERGSTMNEFVSAQDLSETMGQLAKYLADQVRNNSALLTDPVAVTKVKTPADITASLKKQSKSLLMASWDLGVENAKREVEKAGRGRINKKDFTRFTSIGEIATKFFSAKSFQMAGGLSDEAMSTFKNIILNGIKYSKSTDDVVKDIYRSFASKGMISEDDAYQALGEALGIENPTYRLNTIIRTNGFEAINEARFSFFTDPDLGGFVEALAYDAVLDSRTTEICSQLDGKVYALRSDSWEQYRPPNHYNCRSLLIPVTINDDVQQTTEKPSVTPQEGFK